MLDHCVPVCSSSVPCIQELCMRLTDESNLFFLYAFEMADDDFKTCVILSTLCISCCSCLFSVCRLKHAQNLKVDFQTFPASIVQLLRTCTTEAQSTHPKHGNIIIYNATKSYCLCQVSAGAGCRSGHRHCHTEHYRAAFVQESRPPQSQVRQLI